MNRRNILVWLVSLIFGFGPFSGYATGQWKAAKTLKRLSVELGVDELEAVIEADGVMEHRVYVVEDPPQIVLDVMNVANPLKGQKPNEPHGLLEQVWSQELPMVAYDPKMTESSFGRIIFELKRPAQHTTQVEEDRIRLRLFSTGPESANSEEREESVSASTDETDLWSDLEARIEPADVGADVFFGAAPSGLEQYRIGPEDLLEIGVFEADQLNRTVRVEADGNVTLPLIGSVNVLGLNARQAAEQVAAKLRQGFLDDPQVTVLIKEYNSQKVSFLGSVERPDAYPLVGQRNLLQLTAEAGGLSSEAGSSLYVFRQLPDGRSARLAIPLNKLLVQGDPRWNIRIQPGDVVSVPPEDAIAVSVVGAVLKPGVYKLPAGREATLLRAIALAGGLKDRASKTTFRSSA